MSNKSDHIGIGRLRHLKKKDLDEEETLLKKLGIDNPINLA